jgi:RNA polymerase sigma-70 factor, ECF subfamily
MVAARRHGGGEPDTILVDRIRNGDTVAFDALVRRHLPAALALAHRLLGHRQDAEDVTQEAFLAALQHLDRFDSQRAFAPWFFTIVGNTALNARKRLARRATEALPEDVPSNGVPPTAAVEARETRERVRVALQRLPERQRTIIQLSGFDGLTSREIGEILGIPAGTVRWELHQARRALHDELATCRETGS